MKNTHPIFVLGLGFPGIDIIKYFKKKKILTVGFDFRDSVIGFYLRKQIIVKCPDPEKDEDGFIEFIIAFSKKHDQKAVLMITSDTFIPAIQKNKETLRNYLLFNISIDGVIEDFLSKKGLYERALSSGVAAPFTIFPESKEELHKQIDEMHFPCIIKPQFAPDWRSEPIKTLVYGQKVFKVENKNELIQKYDELTKSHSHKLIIQEIIQGPDENLLYFVSYINRQGKFSGYFCGQKLRISPIHFGSASYMRTIDASILKDQCLQFLVQNKYWGPSGIEFKKDDQDGEYKLVEVNARFGLWDVIGQKIGVNLFHLAYLDLIGENVETKEPEDIEYYWLSLSRDIMTFVEYKKENLITIFEWIKSFFGKVYIEDIFLDEPKIMYNLYLRRILRKIFGK